MTRLTFIGRRHLVPLGLITALFATVVLSVPAGATPALMAQVPVAPADGAAGRVIAVGDSIMLGAKPQLESSFSTIGWPSVLDMEVSRSTGAGAIALASHAPGPADTVVISLGANDSGDLAMFRSRVNQVLMAAATARKVYWLTIPEVRDYYPAANAVLREAAAGTTNTEIIDWSAVSTTTPGLTARDGLHLTPAGAQSMADTIVGQILNDVAVALAEATTTTAVEAEPTTPTATTIDSGSQSAPHESAPPSERGEVDSGPTQPSSSRTHSPNDLSRSSRSEVLTIGLLAGGLLLVIVALGALVVGARAVIGLFRRATGSDQDG